jgi:predicted ATP-grasp superfamily ATP-dependent carboligase
MAQECGFAGEQKTVLVATEHTADDRKTLATVRALARAGARVIVGSDDPLSPPLWSRHAAARVRYPDPDGQELAFVDWLLAGLRKGLYDAVLPLSDATTVAMARWKPAIETYLPLPVPDFATWERAHDKLDLLRLADRAGIATPRTYCPASRDELRAIADALAYPCVFKLRRGAGGAGLLFPRSARELLDHYDALPAVSGPVIDTTRPLLQELVRGELHDVVALVNHGEPRAAVTQRRRVMFPPQGGIGLYNETTWEPELRDQALDLLRQLRWHGPAMVEFRRDERDGRFKLMEVNGRFWATLDLAIQAGVDFPTLACRMVLEGDVEPRFAYRVGLRYRWLFPYAFLPAPTGPAWRHLRDVLRLGSADHSDLWLSDPLPHVVLAWLWLRGRWHGRPGSLPVPGRPDLRDRGTHRPSLAGPGPAAPCAPATGP